MTSTLITFDSNDFSEFDTLNGVPTSICTTTTPGLAGTTAKCALQHDPSPPHYAEKNVGTSLTGTVFRFAAYIQTSGLSFFSLGYFLGASLNDSSTFITQIGIIDNGSGGFNVYCTAVHSGGSSTIQGTTDFAMGTLVTVEVRIVRGTATAGEFYLYGNGNLEGSLTGVDNSAEFDSVLGVCRIQVFPQNSSGGTGGSGTLYIDEIAFNNTDTPIYPPSAGDDTFTAAPMTRPASIDADGGYIYIAAINSLGFPVLIQFDTALNADGSIVFDPGAGTDIGVECSPTDPDVIWIAGEFDSTNTVERSNDAAASFDVVDPGTFDPVTAFKVGPSDDGWCLVATESGVSATFVEIHETKDDGTNWTAVNDSLTTPARILAMDRLDINPDEVIFGNEDNSTDRSDYSPNAGADLDDITTGTPTDDSTTVIVG